MQPKFPTTIILPSKLLLLKRPEDDITDPRKRKRQFEPHVPTITRIADFLAHGTDEPDLSHAHHGAEDAEAESQDGGHPGGKQVRGVPDGDVVFALLEDEVFAEGDGFVDGKPVALWGKKVGLGNVDFMSLKRERETYDE